MNSYDILYGMEYVDTDIINKALNYGKKRRMYGIIKGLSVACLAVAVLVVGINVQNTLSVKNSDITMRFGVFPVNTAIENPFKSESSGADIPWFSTYMSNLINKDNKALVYGTAYNIQTVKTTSDGITWYITVFDIIIIRTIKTAPESGTIKAVCINYDESQRLSGYPQVSMDILNNPTAFFVLYYEPNEMFEAGNTGINVYDYADYRVGGYYKADKNGAWIYTGDVYFTFDDLKGFCNNAPLDEEFFASESFSEKYLTSNTH